MAVDCPMILLDTHAFVWLASDRKQLSQRADQTVRKNERALAVSVVVAWEIALLYKKGRLLLPLPPAEFVEKALRRHSILELPLSRQAVLDAVALPDIHNDPFDRILVAEARHRKASIISKDQTIPQYPDITVVW